MLFFFTSRQEPTGFSNAVHTVAPYLNRHLYLKVIPNEFLRGAASRDPFFPPILQSRGCHVLSGSLSSASPFVPFCRQELRLSCSAAIEIPHRAGPAHHELRHWQPRKKRRSQAVVMIKSGSASASWAKSFAEPAPCFVSRSALSLNGSRGNLIYIPGPAFFPPELVRPLKKKS